MNHVNLFMPKPIPVPSAELEALQATMNHLQHLSPNASLPDNKQALTNFLETTPIIFAGGYSNRGMLTAIIPFGRQVMASRNFIPWLNMQETVSTWLTWAEKRRDGMFNDEIDEQSLCVDRATKEMPILAAQHQGLKRVLYPEELPIPLATWCVHSEAKGYCVFAMHESEVVTNIEAFKYASTDCELIPVKAVLHCGYIIRDGVIVLKGESYDPDKERQFYEFEQ
ncbi:hypothetical protein R7127_08000 [Vibrio sp. 1159]|uniref:hypothetical protein n=1 Tax=Vibrio sp. 1159 TaxID=3074545 RepID=UPI002963D544|nr:hypothetical protein [Vibrio sp. 1159]MDW2320221.1 hypothetical protein [Vibrio sp. 1159]